MDVKARARAEAAIRAVFAKYRKTQATDPRMLATLSSGKLYELYVLSQVVTDLDNRGFTLTFVGSTPLSGSAGAVRSTLKFKGAPGMIKLSDSHFEVMVPGSSQPTYRLFLNIEFDTLGSKLNSVSDDSGRHELDIILTPATTGYPTNDEILLGVECKAVANFEKGLVKEALGVRREMSLLCSGQPSDLSLLCGGPIKIVSADPPSEFILAYLDPKGDHYADSPRSFGIDFTLLQP